MTIAISIFLSHLTSTGQTSSRRNSTSSQTTQHVPMHHASHTSLPGQCSHITIETVETDGGACEEENEDEEEEEEKEEVIGSDIEDGMQVDVDDIVKTMTSCQVDNPLTGKS